jgi:FtsP/CotA-like multicopper oxidase with cupredoxin domain
MENKNRQFGRLARRDFLKLAGGALAATAGASMIPTVFNKMLQPAGLVSADYGDPPNLYLAGTDTWISVPGGIPIYHPDPAAPAPFTTYMFGFRNVLGMDQETKEAQKGKAQYPSPLFWIDQYDEAENPNEFRLQLTNLGLAVRPDLIDEHTVHFHGLRNIIPFFDGEPNTSLAVPILGEFTYAWRVREPGTYMYHCHVEDVEHVHLGMTGMVFVRPLQDGQNFGGFTKFAYNDGDGSTGYDREYSMLLTEIWASAHWAFAHVQLPNWDEYKADFYLLNGRVYPDTIAPGGHVDFGTPEFDPVTGEMPVPADPRLQYQPISSLVRCNQGERVLLRFANLGFTKQNMTLSGIKMRVVGKDATLLRGRDGKDLSFDTDGIFIGVGESYDAIFTAPAFDPALAQTAPGETAPHNKYLLYNRNYSHFNHVVGDGYGGQTTEVRVYLDNIADQVEPNGPDTFINI